ncbi:uncharacterized protein LACBIDRAFT_308388 [Laccaria bicolor S238N-H82]|uniref:Predicted protein n=1 Tax=Laccaria bicolor (strain S238N-H82 / ATCC MYA-4686) TaxID=486041 RepID=B0CW58_LACBS|nr:uncharacterized protein LACBIDRAFT_308388 [Laccaria bicolor S238N-H82]EDR13453.1 predicted protein [Laccaria bicolor S238N-H82]|eukprot:XP_001875951.1 predicted protein [Laccaria bicolor S238N-H82]
MAVTSKAFVALPIVHTKLIWMSICSIVFKGSVQSGFLPRKRATVDRNRSRTDPNIEGTEPNHLGPVFCSP